MVLQDIIENDEIKLDFFFKASLTNDLVNVSIARAVSGALSKPGCLGYGHCGSFVHFLNRFKKISVSVALVLFTQVVSRSNRVAYYHSK